MYGFSQELSPRDIAYKLYNREDGVNQITLQELSSCRYVIKDQRPGCAEKPRRKVIESVRKDFGENLKDVRSVSIVKSPAAERGIGFLQYDYEEPSKDADQWMYLSALGKVKRIVSGNDNEPKSGSFFGSEFSYEDMEKPYLENYTYKLLKTVDYRERDCWVLEITPTPEYAPKSNYQKSINWIDKERNIGLKTILYDRQGNIVKKIVSYDIKNIDGVWMPMIVNVDNVQTKRMTTLKIQKTALNIDEIQDDFLSLRALTDSAFRERHLNSYRQFIE
ncbi:outer membrane lipoprotein-sorting protein [Paraneptunicella aestuarii]|uniref:outer membrane lipoprotein-sorting protein n=1 Tax=Paraneptunicella aestuarii TaxID=2831148 RepID=UPI001E4AB3ED|nr:outer membrane lipoprotein-sorting protein [Paraneptunicella aestuarii]UAA37168.1 outer membrane lipoprotein-sorting protein [Paraneptunicella aestuarii]